MNLGYNGSSSGSGDGEFIILPASHPRSGGGPAYTIDGTVPYVWSSMNHIPSSQLITIIFTSLFTLLAGAVLYLWAYRRAQCGSRDPKTWPLLGAQLEAARNYDCLLDWITTFFHHNHRTVKMRTLGRTSYLTVDPANIEHILKTNFANFPKGEDLHSRQFDMLGNGILNTDGHLWKSHRKLASLEFSVKKLRKLSSTVYTTNALKLVNVLATTASQGVDMQELLLAMTFDSICQVVLGEEFDTLSNPSACPYSAVAKALDNAQEMITRRYMFPWWRIQRYLDVGSEKIFREELGKFKQFLADVIHKRRVQLIDQAMNIADTITKTSDANANQYGPAALKEFIADAPDLLSRFIIQLASEDISSKTANRISTNYLEEEEASRKSCGQLEEVRDAMINFILAGRDTTGSTLSWFLYCMCSHPDKQERVFEELLELEKLRATKTANVTHPGDDDSRHCQQGPLNSWEFREFSELLTYDNLQTQMPYLHAAIAETLRLHPAVPRDGKTTLSDDVLPDGTVLKAGDQIAYIPYSMGRMPFLWGEDALEFKPERWLRSHEDGKLFIQPESPFKFTAFQAGPRMCLGKDAAYLQMKITAALLLRFFRFELVPDHPVRYRMMAVMSMKHGLKLNFSLRRR